MTTKTPNTDIQDGQPPRILIVDDDLAARLLTSAALKKAGFNVAEAETGREAVESVRESLPDLVLLDVIMPEMDGFAACVEIRKLPGAEYLPVLMMTGLDDVESINSAFEAGATDFTSKPINYLLLAHRIRYILRSKRTADELRASEARLANAQRIARIGHFEWHVETGQIQCSLQAAALFGIPDSDAIRSQQDLLRCIHPGDRKNFLDAVQKVLSERGSYSLEHRIIRSDGKVRIVYQRGESLPGKQGLQISATIQDVTFRHRMQRQVTKIANYDTLTHLPNRALMLRYLGEAIQLARQHRKVVAVLAIDLDHFSRINDTLGHDTGDELLKTVAERLQECLRPCSAMRRLRSGLLVDGDLLARSGGDEYVVILPQIETLEDAAVVARRIIEAMTKPSMVGTRELAATVSIGISGFPIDALDSEALLRHANTALRHAKSMGRNRWEFSTESMNSRAAERFKIEGQLRTALAAQQFQLHYQPKVRLKDQTVCGAEALLRWQHPEEGYVPPSSFIPIAEETGLIVPIGEWILWEACRQIQTWRRQGLPPATVSVNLSAAQFRMPGLHVLIAGVIADTGVDASLLELELTESLLMGEREASMKMMRRLRSLGVSLSLDDFGTGYSSFSYLKRFPINTLKIDRSFLVDIASNPDDGAIVSTIISLAHSLRLAAVAEGVETAAQLEFLSRRGCDVVQGYVYSKPLNADAFAEWLQNRRSPLPLSA
jgi:diguanylate cyclase (GGDEF)-like protein/PAS domain S-box-containing protein